jgi:hypothetical protein
VPETFAMGFIYDRVLALVFVFGLLFAGTGMAPF